MSCTGSGRFIWYYCHIDPNVMEASWKTLTSERKAAVISPGCCHPAARVAYRTEVIRPLCFSLLLIHVFPRMTGLVGRLVCCRGALSVRCLPPSLNLHLHVLSVSLLHTFLGSASDPYVKASLVCDGRRLKKRKTSIKKNTLNPTYNEALVFDIPNENIESVSIVIAVMDYDWWASWCVFISLHASGALRTNPSSLWGGCLSKHVVVVVFVFLGGGHILMVLLLC